MHPVGAVVAVGDEIKTQLALGHFGGHIDIAGNIQIAITDQLRKGLDYLGVELLGHYIAAGGRLTQVP